MKRFTEEQINGILGEQEADAKSGDLACKHGVSEVRLCNWKVKLGGSDFLVARGLEGSGGSERQAKWLLADAMLVIMALKDVLPRNGEGRRQA